MNEGQLPNQSIDGNNNNQAGRDVVHNHQPTFISNTENESAIEFYEKDIVEIIDCFSNEVITPDVKEEITDLIKVDLANTKNPLNNLTPPYFRFMQESSLPYFQKVDSFLKDTINKLHLDKYKNIVFELQHNILVHRNKEETFEKIFDVLKKQILEKHPEMKADTRLILTFLHFMYWNCDIGIKHAETTQVS